MKARGGAAVDDSWEPKAKIASQSHRQDFRLKDATPFARAIEALEPRAGGRTIAKLLDGKANRTTALDWKSGRRNAPQWALDLLAAKIQERAERLSEIAAITRSTPPRPGKQAGARNLAAWRAARYR